MDSARDLVEWEQPAPPIAPGPVRFKQEDYVIFKLLEELDKSATASSKKGRSTSVLFTEFSKKSLHEVVDGLAPMMAMEVLKEILWEVAECGAAVVRARDLGEWGQPAHPVASCPVRSK